MKKSLIIVLIILFFGAFKLFQEDIVFRNINNRSFKNGEILKFRVHYGLINAGEATMQIHKNIQSVKNRPCYKVDIYGKSTGLFDMMLRIRDNWGAYVDTTAIIPIKSYRNIEEGKYRKFEITDYNHYKNEVTVTTLDKNTKAVKNKKGYQVDNNVQDIVSGYYYLRTFNYNKMKQGEIIKFEAFFEDTTYNFQVRYLGKEQLSTKLGVMNTIVLSPLMPNNKMFDGENAIKVWLSDDQNKIPLKVQAQMFVGAVEIDIKSYSNLRN